MRYQRAVNRVCEIFLQYICLSAKWFCSTNDLMILVIVYLSKRYRILMSNPELSVPFEAKQSKYEIQT